MGIHEKPNKPNFIQVILYTLHIPENFCILASPHTCTFTCTLSFLAVILMSHARKLMKLGEKNTKLQLLNCAAKT